MSKRTPSRPERWTAAVQTAMDAVQAAMAARYEATSALEELRGIQEEYSEWRDNMPDSLRSSALGEKLDAICDLDLEPDEDDLSQIEAAANEAEAAELPLGFGRD